MSFADSAYVRNRQLIARRGANLSAYCIECGACSDGRPIPVHLYRNAYVPRAVNEFDDAYGWPWFWRWLGMGATTSTLYSPERMIYQDERAAEGIVTLLVGIAGLFTARKRLLCWAYAPPIAWRWDAAGDCSAPRHLLYSSRLRRSGTR